MEDVALCATDFKRIMQNIIIVKSMDFAVRIVNLYKYLCKEKNENIMAKQVLRSGTSIGANVREGVYAASKADFIAKLTISLKEANETAYWLELLAKTDYLTQEQYNDIGNDCTELIKILTSIVKKSKKQSPAGDNHHY